MDAEMRILHGKVREYKAIGTFATVGAWYIHGKLYDEGSPS